MQKIINLWKAFLILRVKIFVAWFNFWIGFYFDRKNNVLYFCPLPMLVFKIWKPKVVERRIIGKISSEFQTKIPDVRFDLSALDEKTLNQITDQIKNCQRKFFDEHSAKLFSGSAGDFFSTPSSQTRSFEAKPESDNEESNITPENTG